MEPSGAPVHGPYEFHLSDAERAQAVATLRRHGLPDGRPIIVLHPGANWPHKRWPPERFAALANRLAEREAVALVVTGSPADDPLVRALCQDLRHQPVILAGRTSLRELAASLEQAAVVVANDTGVLHVAVALGRPVVALYGPTSPTLTGPLGDPRRIVVIHHLDCCPSIPCYHPDHPDRPGMRAIAVDEVYEATRQLLQGQGAGDVGRGRRP